MDKRQLYDAIAKRCSRRKYLPQPLSPEIIDQLSTSVERYNQANEFHIQLILNQPEVFQGLRKSYGFFTGVQHYFALVGKKNQPHIQEKLVFFCELLVLEANSGIMMDNFIELSENGYLDAKCIYKEAILSLFTLK